MIGATARSSDSGGSNHDVAINELIWMSVKPLIKLVIPAAAGVGLTLAGLFPVAASRGASQSQCEIDWPNLKTELTRCPLSGIVPSHSQRDVARALG